MDEHRITYDAKELTRMIENELDKLKVFQFDSRCRSLLGNSFINLLTKWEQDIRERKDDPFTLVVCGEFKRGKSSLINALLGEEVVSTNVTTETVTLNRISYGAHSNEAQLEGGRRMQLSDGEMKRDSLEVLMNQSGERFKQIEIKRPIELLKNVTIVDTPGLGDSLGDFSELVEQALCQADAVIYVFSIRYPLAQSEQLFLKTVILPQKYTELMLVGNYVDTLSNPSDCERMQQMLVQRIQGLLPDQRPWMVSALDEICRRTGEERPNPGMEQQLEAYFDAFRGKIDQLVMDKKELVLPDRMQRMVRGMLAELYESLDALEEGLAMSSQDIREAVERVNEQKGQQIQTQEKAGQRIDGMMEEMKAEAYEWIEDLLDRMQEETLSLSDVPAEDLSKYYSFYCIDTLQEAMNRCLEYHTLLLYDELDEISRDITSGLSRRASGAACGFRFALDNRTWTMGDNVSFVVSKLGSLGLLSLVADGVAGSMRQKEMANKTPDILKSIAAQYSGLRGAVQQAVERTYGQLAENVKKQLAEYYGGRIQAVQEQMEQTAMVARQDEEHKAEIQKEITQIRTILNEVNRNLGGV